MRKIGDDSKRINVRVPGRIATWLNSKAKANGLTLSDQIRQTLIEVKSAEAMLIDGVKAIKEAKS